MEHDCPSLPVKAVGHLPVKQSPAIGHINAVVATEVKKPFKRSKGLLPRELLVILLFIVICEITLHTHRGYECAKSDQTNNA